MTSPSLPSWAHKIVLGIVCTVVIAAGGSIIANASENAVQNERLDTLERTAQAMADLSDKLDETNKNVAVLNTRLEERSR